MPSTVQTVAFNTTTGKWVATLDSATTTQQSFAFSISPYNSSGPPVLTFDNTNITYLSPNIVVPVGVSSVSFSAWYLSTTGTIGQVVTITVGGVAGSFDFAPYGIVDVVPPTAGNPNIQKVATGGVAIAYDYSEPLARIITALEKLATSTATIAINTSIIANNTSVIANNTSVLSANSSTMTSAAVSGNSVDKITVTDGGDGYSSTPSVILSAPATGSDPITISTSVSGGAVVMSLSHTGSGYDTTPIITIGYPTGVTAPVEFSSLITTDATTGDVTITPVTVGQYIKNNNLFYLVYSLVPPATVGTVSTTTPTHTSGRVNNGTVVLEYKGRQATAIARRPNGQGIRMASPWEWLGMSSIVKYYEEQGINVASLKQAVDTLPKS